MSRGRGQRRQQEQVEMALQYLGTQSFVSLGIERVYVKPYSGARARPDRATLPKPVAPAARRRRLACHARGRDGDRPGGQGVDPEPVSDSVAVDGARTPLRASGA